MPPQATANPERRPDVETYLLPDGSCLLFDSRTEEAHVLNTVGALVWDYCDGTLSAEQIADELAPLLPEQPTLGDDVREMIEALAGKGLLQDADASPPPARPDVAATPTT
ncbi:MAG TPA: PqqD family protein [Ktedonobacterales bacterium]|nr:PqqD family protein [Ktedonobacterales bacterium]